MNRLESINSIPPAPVWNDSSEVATRKELIGQSHAGLQAALLIGEFRPGLSEDISIQKLREVKNKIAAGQPDITPVFL